MKAGPARLVPIVLLIVCASQAEPRARVLSPVQERHLETYGIASGAFGPGGFFSGGFDGALLAHDERGTPGDSPIPLGQLPVDALTVLDNGDLLASAGGRILRVSGRRRAESSVWSDGSFVAISQVKCAAGGRACFVAGDDRGMLVVGTADPPEKRSSLRGSNGGLRGLAALPRGGLALVGDDGRLRVRASLAAGAPEAVHELRRPGSALALFVSPPGPTAAGAQPTGAATAGRAMLLAAGTTTGELHVLEVEEMSGSAAPTLRTVAHGRVSKQPISAIAFSADGRELLAGTAGGRLIRVATTSGKLAIRSRSTVDFEGHLDSVLAIRPTKTGWQSAAAEGLVRNWTQTGTPVAPAYLGHRDAVTAVRFVTDAVLVSGGGSQGLELGIRRTSPDGVPRLPALALAREEVSSIDVGAKGAFVVGTWDSRLHLFADPLGTPRTIRLPGVPVVVRHLPGGRFAVGDDRGHLFVTDGQGKTTLDIKIHKSRTSALAVSPDGTRIATGGWDDTVRLFDLKGKALWARKDHTDPISALAWSRDGARVLSGAWDNRIHVRKSSTGEIERTCEGHTDWVREIAVHPTRAVFVSVGDDRRLFVWDYNCRKLTERRLHQDVIASVTISPDGLLVASGGRDRRVYVMSFAELVR